MTHYSIPDEIENRFEFRLEGSVEKEEIRELMDAVKQKEALRKQEQEFWEKLGGQAKKMPAVKAPQKPPFSKVVRSPEDHVCDRCGAKVASNHRLVHENWHANQRDELMSMAVELVKTLASIPVLDESEDA